MNTSNMLKLLDGLITTTRNQSKTRSLRIFFAKRSLKLTVIFAVDRFELLECLGKIYLKPLSDLHQVGRLLLTK